MSATWIYGGVDITHENAVLSIIKERKRQDRLKAAGRFRFTCADVGIGNAERLACCMEELGEVAQQVLEHKDRRLTADTHDATEEHLREEITQVAALCLAWLESPCNPTPVIT